MVVYFMPKGKEAGWVRWGGVALLEQGHLLGIILYIHAKLVKINPLNDGILC